jgi:hypothetical protein
MAALVGAAYAVSRPRGAAAASVSSEPAASSVTRTTGAGDARPIELLSLRHSVDSDGAFTVTGLVQNPFDGRVVRGVDAVVYLFDRDGKSLGTGQAALDFTALPPGDESPFVVRVPKAGPVSRYRVGFRSQEGGVVAHVDRRGQLPGGPVGDAIEGRPAVVPAIRSTRSEG